MNKNTKIIFTLTLLLVIILSGCKARDSFREKITSLSKKDVIKREFTIGEQANSIKPGDYSYKIMIDNIEREYLLHVPKSYDNKPTPLILAFHGGMGTATKMTEQYGLIEKSDKEGFVVAFLNGASRLPSGKLATWNAGNCCAYAVESGSDDTGFVKATLDDIESKINIEKVFALGMSNGGMMSYRLACEMSDTFSAIASVAGTNNYEGCNPEKPISVLHIHALNDQHVLFEGGCGPDCKIESETEFNSVANTISDWVERNNCDLTPKRVLEKNGAYCDLYSGCDGDVQVKSCVTDDGGHSWPGLQNQNDNPLEKTAPSDKIFATNEIWDFFKTR